MKVDLKRETLISVKEVSKIYRMGEVDVPALREATIDIFDGEFLVVSGPSGSGKSTLLNIIGGMDRPTKGNVQFLNRDISTASDRDLTLFRRNEVGFVFQFYNLIPTLTAMENVQVAVELVQDPLEPLEALRLVGLSDRANHFPSQLSGGEQQRVSIARALASNPRLVLCDEPTGALDMETGRQVLALLQQLNRDLQKTIILITHNQAIAAIGNRVAKLRDGKIKELIVNESPAKAMEISW